MWINVKKPNSLTSQHRFWWMFERIIIAMMWACSGFLAFVMIYCLLGNFSGVTIAFDLAKEQIAETVILILLTISGGVVWFRLMR